MKIYLEVKPTRAESVERHIRQVKTKYSTGDIWLKTPLEEKEPFKWAKIKDFGYILPCALERGLMHYPEYRKVIIDYYSKFFNRVSGLCKELAEHYQFVTEEEVEALKALRKDSEKEYFVSSFISCALYLERN